jgi:hypothetical protein
MALKFGRSTVKTTDPQGNRIADPDVYGKKSSSGTVSSWPEVRKLYKAGRLDEELKGRTMNPEIMNYLSGNQNNLSDVEFEEPIIGFVNTESGGRKRTLETNYKKGGKNYTALNKEADKWNGIAPKMEPGMMRVFTSESKVGDARNRAQGAANSFAEDLDVYRKKPDPVPVVEPPVVKQPDPVPSVVTEDKIQPPAAVTPKKVKAKPPVVVEKDAFVTPEKNYKLPKKVSMNPFAGGATSQGSTKRYLGQVAESVGSRVKNVLKGNVNKGYMKEQKLFYDTYGGGETIGKEGFGDMSLDEVRGLKKKIKADPALSKSDFKEGKRDLNSAIRLKKLESKDKVNFWTEAKGKEYRNSADYETSRSAYRSQTDNPANSNTITNQQLKLGAASADAAPTSYYATRGQMKDEFAKNNPTASPSQIRKGVRGQIQTNRQTQIDLRKKEQEKGMY